MYEWIQPIGMIMIERQTDKKRAKQSMKMKEILNNMTKDQYRFPYLPSCMVVVSVFELFDMWIWVDINPIWMPYSNVCNYTYIYLLNLKPTFFYNIFTKFEVWSVCIVIMYVSISISILKFYYFDHLCIIGYF